MQRNVFKPADGQIALIEANRSPKIICLTMKDKRKEIVLGLTAQVARLVNEYRELPHLPPPRDIKNAGGNPPALDSPLLRDDQLLYITAYPEMQGNS